MTHGDPLPQPNKVTSRRQLYEEALAGEAWAAAEIERLQSGLAATLAELDGLRKDKERLDWLDSKRILHIHGDAPGDFEFSPRGMGLRAAIDLEMEGRP